MGAYTWGGPQNGRPGPAAGEGRSVLDLVAGQRRGLTVRHLTHPHCFPVSCFFCVFIPFCVASRGAGETLPLRSSWSTHQSILSFIRCCSVPCCPSGDHTRAHASGEHSGACGRRRKRDLGPLLSFPLSSLSVCLLLVIQSSQRTSQEQPRSAADLQNQQTDPHQHQAIRQYFPYPFPATVLTNGCNPSG